jgi:hypothetical protein
MAAMKCEIESERTKARTRRRRRFPRCHLFFLFLGFDSASIHTNTVRLRFENRLALDVLLRNMKINAIIATMVTFGLSFAIAAEPETVADTDSKNVDWWVQRTHPASIKEIPKERGWTHLEHNGLKIAVLIGMSWTGGESNIPVSAYLYNQSFKVWRQFMTLHTRNAYDLQAAIDGKRNVLEIVGGRHSPLEGTIIASYSLEAVSDDRAYVEIESETEPQR